MTKSKGLDSLSMKRVFLILLAFSLLIAFPLISAERGVTVESGVGGVYTIYNYVNETDTANYWDALDTPADITHASLGSLQGGIGGEYYHVQQSWFDEITTDLFNWLTASEVYTVADLNYSQIYTDLVGAINGNYTASGNEWSPAMINNISLINTDINSALESNKTIIFQTADANYSAIYGYMLGNYSLINTDINAAIGGNKTEIYGEAYGAANLNYSEIYSLITGNYTAGEGAYNSTAWNRTGTNVFLANDGDSVGIGTSSPTADLEVDSTNLASDGALSTAAMAFTFDGASGNPSTDLIIGMDNTALRPFIQSRSADTTYRELLLNPYGGNVGIGTTAPQQRLNVVGDANITSTLTLGGNITFGKEDTDYLITAFGNGGAINIKSDVDSTNRYLQMGFIDNNRVFTPSIIVSNGGDVNVTGMIFSNLTNVGIGTASPQSLFEVNGSVSSTRISDYGNELIFSRAGQNYIVAEDAAGTLDFKTGGSASENERMRIMSNGNVGIGTTSPNQGGYSGTVLTINSSNAPVIEGIRGMTAGNSLAFTFRGGSTSNSALGGFTVYSGTTNTKGNVRFQTSDGGSVLDRMIIDESGYVGINTTLPVVPLQVNGSVENISIMAEAQIVSPGFVVMSPSLSSYTGNLLSTIPKPTSILGADGKLNRLTMFENEKQITKLNVPDYSKPTENIGYNEVCENVYLRDDCAMIQTGETCEVIEEVETCTPIYEEQCTPVYERQCSQVPYTYITYPTIQQNIDSMEISNLAFNNRLLISELKEENTKFKNCLSIAKDFTEYKTCAGGI